MHSGGLLAGLELRFTSTAERLLEAGGISTQQTRLDPSGNDSAIRRCLRISDQRAQPWCLQLHQDPSWLSPLHFNPHKPNVPGLQLGDFLAYDLLSASHVKTPRPSAVPQMQSSRDLLWTQKQHHASQKNPMDAAITLFKLVRKISESATYIQSANTAQEP